jgi:hypothetical protein
MRFAAFTKLMLAATACAVIGCGNPTAPFATDQKYARDVIDCIYAGSVSPIEYTFDHGDRTYLALSYLADFVLEWTGKALADEFGAVQHVTLQSSEVKPAPGIFGHERGCTITVWTVQADRGSFDMALYFKNGKTLGVTLKTDPTGEFEPPPIIASEWRRKKGLPPGWK